MSTCELCKYTTDAMSNFYKHCRSKTHIAREEKNLLCYLCNKTFKVLDYYKKHIRKTHDEKIKKRKKKSNKNNETTTQKEVICYDKIQNIVDKSKDEIKEEINNSKKEVVTVVNKAINKASSLIKYLMENHKSVPPLKKITKQQCITILRKDYDCPEKEKDYSLQQLFIRDYGRNLFVSNVAKSILTLINYKNKDTQPIYNTDSSRYNYVVKITAELWNEDKAGIKFTDYIIRPLLRYIRELIEEYIEDDLEQINPYKNSYLQNELLLDEKEKAYSLDIALTNDYLIKPLLKELSPYLRFLQLELEEMEKLEELKKIQEDLEDIISDNNNYINGTSKKLINNDSDEDINDDNDNDSINDCYIKKISKRLIK
jgi:hypothetical protein